MFRNILLLTGLCVVWAFIGNARGELFLSEIERDDNYDTFTTNKSCRKNCSDFGAEEYRGRCKCKSNSHPEALFLRSKRSCETGGSFNKQENCQKWRKRNAPAKFDVKVINATAVNESHEFKKNPLSSCQPTPFIAFLDAAGNWVKFNLSTGVLEVLNDPAIGPFFASIKITRLSQTLNNLSGHVIKLGLNCTGYQGSHTCLLFRLKGVLKFPLCNYTVPTTSLTPPTTSPAPSTTSPTFSIMSPSPSIVTMSSSTLSIITTTPLPTTTPATPTPPSDTKWQILAAILGAVLFLAVIFGVVRYLLYRRNCICKSRERQVAVIFTPDEQSNREYEEHVYDDLLEVCPSNEQMTAEMKEHKRSEEQLILTVRNPYVTDSSLSGPRPLPSQPDQNSDRGATDQSIVSYDQSDVSVVLENPGVQGILSGSLQRERNDLSHQQEVSEEREAEWDHHEHQHHRIDTVDGSDEDDVDYQGLLKGKRAQSMFICPSCNENTNYQRLSRPGHCPHADMNQQRKEKSRSFYESLTPERGARESVYMNPSHTGEEEQDNTNKMPDYHTLEPDESEPNDAADEPASHDYNVLEEPEQETSEPGDEDKGHSDSIRTDRNAGEPAVSVNAENKLVCAVYEGKPAVSVNTKNNHIYAVPCKEKTAKKAESACNELDEESSKVDDVCPTDVVKVETLDRSVFTEMEDNPANTLPWKKNTAKEAESACSEPDDEGQNKTDDTRL